MHHACADPVPAAVLLQEVLLAIAEKHRKQAKRPQLVGLHGRVPNPQLVALMKDCWHPVRSWCLWQLSMFCQSHHTFAFHIQTLCKTAYVLVAHKKLAYALFRGHFPELESVFIITTIIIMVTLLLSGLQCASLACLQTCWMLQDAAQRPDFPTIQQRLARFASETFQCSADDALRAKHLKERALLDQILPPKVHSHAVSYHTLTMCCHLQTLEMFTRHALRFFETGAS